MQQELFDLSSCSSYRLVAFVVGHSRTERSRQKLVKVRARNPAGALGGKISFGKLGVCNAGCDQRSAAERRRRAVGAPANGQGRVKGRGLKWRSPGPGARNFQRISRIYSRR
ncbi:hypothetical protein Zmor_020404 [Zophobas morio]|uniref:Uncharacterized protein n=1 Tax=Zophobas morio TaxID=2755281 RepID=A0AA38I6S2_9CUCU|nr:hypothetical protein Zmor_020404 [Zophobas morio]